MSGSHSFNKRSTILVVDDTPDNLTLIGDMHKDEHTVKVATATRNSAMQHLPLIRNKKTGDSHH
jgi:CheY-like chemotaxis protein